MKNMFFILILLFTISAYSYTAVRIWQLIPNISFIRPAAVAFIAVAFAAFIISMVAGDYLPIPLTTALYKLGTSWFFITIYLVLIFLAIDLFRLTKIYPIDNFVRGSWLGVIAIGGVTAIIMISGYFNYLNKERRELSINIEKEMGGRSVKAVLISDLHLGYNINESEFTQWVTLINNESPDIVLIAGDVIDNSVRPLREGNYTDILKSIKSKYGTYACLGNHEYIASAPESIEFLESAGVNVLIDSSVLIDSRFYVVGRNDLYGHDRKPLQDLFAELDQSKPIIVLNHQPNNLLESEEARVDIQLSGHTHRGQIWPISWITDSMFELSHGHRQKGSTHFYVSTGIGIWGGKFRIGSRSEYVVLSIK